MSESHSKPEDEPFKRRAVTPVPETETEVFDDDARAHWHSSPEAEELLDEELLPDSSAEETPSLLL